MGPCAGVLCLVRKKQVERLPWFLATCDQAQARVICQSPMKCSDDGRCGLRLLGPRMTHWTRTHASQSKRCLRSTRNRFLWPKTSPRQERASSRCGE